MASSLNLRTKYKLKSGYEIPVLGYGVSASSLVGPMSSSLGSFLCNNSPEIN